MIQYLKFSPLWSYVLISVLFVFFSFFANYILYDDSLFYSYLSETLTQDKIRLVIQQQKIYQQIGYAFIPLIILLRSYYTSLCLSTGAFFLELSLTPKQCFNIAIKAEAVFLVGMLIKINYFALFGVDSLTELNVQLLSVSQIIGKTAAWLSYPAGVLNIFELIYWLLLALFVASYTNKTFWKSLSFVATTYGIGLLLWVGAVMFLILNMT